MAIGSKEKEPAPAATDTSSTDPTSKDSTNSISENAGNVKNKIPQAVMDALDEEIIKLKNFIDCDNEGIIEMTESINENIEHITWCENRISEIKAFIEKFGGVEND